LKFLILNFKKGEDEPEVEIIPKKKRFSGLVKNRVQDIEENLVPKTPPKCIIIFIQ